MNRLRKISLFILSLTLLAQQSAMAATSELGEPLAPKLDSDHLAQPREIAASVPKTFKLNAGITQEYVLGPGDVMSVTDLGGEEERPLTVLAPVLPDGTAVLAYAGVMNAAGLSLREINEYVNEKAKRYLKNPEIMVNLAKQRSTQVYVLGEVAKTGLYSPDSANGAKDDAMSDMNSGGNDGPSSGGGASSRSNSSMPVPQGLFTLSAALQMAGGLKETADIRNIHVTRQHPKQVIDVDMWKLMLDGDVSVDIALQPGDVIFVPKGGAEFNDTDFGKVAFANRKVRVIGAVKAPGLYAMAADDDLYSVLARAGGLLPTAKTKFITLSRTARDGTVSTERINIKAGIKNGQNMARARVHPGDIVIADNSIMKLVAVTAGRTVPQMMMNVPTMLLLNRTSTTK